MDTTNLITLPLSTLQALQNSAGGGGGGMTYAIVGLICATVLQGIGQIVSFLKTNSVQTLATETAATLEKVHVDVNSGKTAMVEKFEAKQLANEKLMADMMLEIKRLSSDLATANEKERGSEVAKALAAAPAPTA